MTAFPIPNSRRALMNSVASHREAIRQLVSFGAIGVASTAAYVALYALLREATPAAAANAIALVLTAVGNTAANRWLTFGVRGPGSLARDHAIGLMALGVALVITSASLVILNAIAPRHGRLTEVAILVAANALATLVRFLLLRFALDRPREVGATVEPSVATLSKSERTLG
jgi:putative flippase GtrA